MSSQRREKKQKHTSQDSVCPQQRNLGTIPTCITTKYPQKKAVRKHGLDSPFTKEKTLLSIKKSKISEYEFKLKDFLFPQDLGNGNANFRFLIDLRFKDDKGQYITKQAVMPGVDTYWECDTEKHEDRNFVRAKDKRDNFLNKFNMCAIDEWDKLIFLVKAERFHSIRFSVYDVDRKGAWEAFQKIGGKLLEVGIGIVAGEIKDSAPGSSTASHISDSLGDVASDINSFLIQKATGCDSILFTGSYQFKDCEQNQDVEKSVEGKGEKGNYTVCFHGKKIS